MCHLRSGKLRLDNNLILHEGDGAFIHVNQPNTKLTIENIGRMNVEFLLFDHRINS